jgi:hypothetical protein
MLVLGSWGGDNWNIRKPREIKEIRSIIFVKGEIHDFVRSTIALEISPLHDYM